MWRYGVPPSNSPRSTYDSFTQKVATMTASVMMVLMIIAIITIPLYDCLFLEYTRVSGVVSHRKSYRLAHAGGPMCLAIIETSQGIGVMKTSCGSKIQKGSMVSVKAATTRLSNQVVFSD